MASHDQMPQRYEVTPGSSVDQRARNPRRTTGFSAPLFAGLAAAFASEACTVTLPAEYSIPTIGINMHGSGGSELETNHTQTAVERGAEAPRSVINDRYREMRNAARLELSSTTGSANQLPHLAGEEVFADHEHGLRITGGDQTQFNRTVGGINRAVEAAGAPERTLSVLVHNVESHLTETSPTRSREIADNGGQSVSLRIVNRTAADDARPTQGEGRVVMNAAIPEDDDLTPDENEGAYGDGGTREEARARAFRTLVDTLTPMAGTRFQESGTFRSSAAEGGNTYRLHHTHIDAVIYLNGLNTTYIERNGVVRATLHGRFRISALSNGEHPAPVVRPVQLPEHE